MTDYRRMVYGITGIVVVVLAAMASAVGWLVVAQRDAAARSDRAIQRLVEDVQRLQECTVAVLLVEPDERTADDVRAVCPPIPDLPDDTPDSPQPDEGPTSPAAPAPAPPAPAPAPPPAAAPRPPPAVAPPGPSHIPQQPPRPPPTTSPSEPRPPPLQPLCDLLLRLC